MNVLVDTPLWSLLLRRNAHDLSEREYKLHKSTAELIAEGRAHIVGAVRQELLSGIREESQFEKLKAALRAFTEPNLDIADYEVAAEMSNRCGSRGIQGSPIDFLLCAVAQRRNWEIFTIDQDFLHFSRVLPIKLHQVS
jgi:predicted nucleic acid-binding protein